jgi:hypothetical protein
MSPSVEGYRLLIDNKVSGFDEIDNRNIDFSGRQQKIEHKSATSIISSITGIYTYDKWLTFGLKYGNDQLFFAPNREYLQQDQNVFTDDASQLLMLFSKWNNFSLEVLDVTFLNGDIHLYDVSGDSNGNSGPLIKTIGYVAKIQELRFFYDGYHKYLSPVFVMGRYQYPTIAYKFTTTGTGTNLNYEAESKLQNIDMQSYFLGIETRNIFFDFGLFAGYTQYDFLNEADQHIKIDTSMIMIKIGLNFSNQIKYDWGDLKLNYGFNYSSYIIGDSPNGNENDTSIRSEYEIDGNPNILKLFIKATLTI